MKNINDLLKRFSLSLDKDAIAKDAVINWIDEKMGIVLGKDKINIKNGVLEISTSPIMQSEIRLREETLINDLRSRYSLPITRVLYK